MSGSNLKNVVKSSPGSSKEAEAYEYSVVYKVDEVYIHIPAEQSAAAFELQIAGTVKLAEKVRIKIGQDIL